jgi:hypothetical protein
MRSEAIVSEDGDDNVLHLPPSDLDGRPGTRAPHVMLTGGGSTLDLFGSQFVVLRPAGDAVDDWVPPGVTSHVIDAEPFAEVYGLSAGGATLVRPDGVVAWRARPGRSRRARARSGDRARPQPGVRANGARDRSPTIRFRARPTSPADSACADRALQHSLSGCSECSWQAIGAARPPTRHATSRWLGDGGSGRLRAVLCPA